MYRKEMRELREEWVKMIKNEQGDENERELKKKINLWLTSIDK